ncbi:MAG: ABC transporter substrate-binding protein [Desulforhopalus sp.]
MRKNQLTFRTLLLSIIVCATGTQADAGELTYRLKWLFNASVAGDIYAEEEGYFGKAGLQVKIKEGGPGKDAIKELELGHADFGVASADQVIRAVEKGAEVVVLFQIFQINPMQWIYRETLPEITDLSQLKGKSIGITFGGNDESIMNTLFAKGGIKKDDVEIHSARFDFTPFLTGKVQVWPVYRNSQGVILQDRLQAEGENVRFFNPADFGVNFVANSVITSKKMIENQPDVVLKFQNALLAAWRDALDPVNQESTIAAIAARDKGNNEAIIKLQLLATRELVAAQNIGAIDIDAWIQTEEIMLKEQQIKKPVNIQDRLER